LLVKDAACFCCGIQGIVLKIAACDAEALQPLERLVNGPIDVADFSAVERLVRTVVLHDEIVEPPRFFQYHIGDSGAEPAPYPERFKFLTPWGTHARPIKRQVRIGSNGKIYDFGHILLEMAFGVLEQGGSILVEGGSLSQSIGRAEEYPAALFAQLDDDWRAYSERAQGDGFGYLAPPILSIILTRSAHRNAIPDVLIDLRNEWSTARAKVWSALEELKTARTIREAEDLRRALTEASEIISPHKSEFDSRPIRVFWDIFAASAAGASIAAFSGGNPLVGAAAGTLGGLAKSVPSYMGEFWFSIVRTRSI